MRLWQFWWHTLVIYAQQNPPRLIELIMLVLAMFLLVVWSLIEQWPYLVLSLSFVVGSSVSILVREAIAPSHQPQLTQATAILLLMISMYGFADLVTYLH